MEEQTPVAEEAAEEAADTHLSQAFHRSVLVGEERLRRTWPNLLTTGFVGGMDVGVGVLALLLVMEATDSPMLAALAFSSGFIALVLARSELFTENFLVPVAVVVAERRGYLSLVRLWAGTLVANVAGGLVFVVLVLNGLPQLDGVAVEAGAHYPAMGLGREAFAAAMLAGVVITLMTWIERASRDVGARLTIAVVGGFLLAAGPLNHVVVGSLEMLAGWFTGRAPYSLLDVFGATAWSLAGNMVGGLGLVTLLRLVQVGRRTIELEDAARDSEIS